LEAERQPPSARRPRHGPARARSGRALRLWRRAAHLPPGL